MPRRTKIVATLGPSTDVPGVMEDLIEAGLDLVRINLSHGAYAEHIERLQHARACAKRSKKTLGVLIDLQGPKIRIARFQDPKGVWLQEGAMFCLDVDRDRQMGDETGVGLDYPDLPREVKKGDILLLDDGRITLVVQAVVGARVECSVQTGGRLLSNKGLNRKGGGLSAPSLTDKDKKDIALIAPWEVDYIALSFPKGAKDVRQAKKLIQSHHSHAHIVAKIERAEAVQNIEEIIDAADAVMVARGDLGVEIDYAELPGVQKHIIHAARMRDKAVITATQMMESMVSSTLPTRAEVSDVANAILDGTDAVMLSAETATGAYPTKVVRALDEICLAAERYRLSRVRYPEVGSYEQHDKAIAMAAMYIAHHVKIKAIVALTESGSTPLWMSRVRSGIPIYALSRSKITCGRVTLFRGVYPVDFDFTQYKPWEISQSALALLVRKGFLVPHDKVIVTKGDILGIGGFTNALKILTVPENE